MNMRLLCPLLLSFAGLAAPAMAANDTMSAIKEAARAQANAKMAEKLNLPTAAPVGAKVYIIAPANNATVSSPVTVVFGLSGPSFACGEQTRGMIQERTAGIQNGASPTADVATAVPPRVSFFGSRLNAVDSVLGVKQR